ncbi:MAG: class I SAM-dependent methyltransferase [Calditrichaeota bacterium]|nr:MAG: class I SAM-dependent methyltransferase [Calditrichota bacterium]
MEFSVLKNYLSKKLDWRTAEVTFTYSEVSLWSSQFGNLMFEHLPISKFKNVLDIGFGAGFPLLEIAQRFGKNSKVYGIDPWTEAVKIARKKAKILGIENVEILESDASNLDFENDFFDLAVCNLGINNFENPEKVMSEVQRTLKPNAKFCTTSNLSGSFEEFYQVYGETLKELGLGHLQSKLEEQKAHRGTIESFTELFDKAGLKITKKVEDKFHWRFADGTSLLNYAFVLIGFLEGWRGIIEPEIEEQVFEKLESNLNKLAESKSELRLTIPMVYFECE